MENKFNFKKISDFFDGDSRISKHCDDAYKNVNIDILELYRFTQWIEEELYEEGSKYDYNEDWKRPELVELIRYNQKQAIDSFRERFMKDMWESFYNKELVSDEIQKLIDDENKLRWG
jgi:hypothetical protein